MGLWKTQKKAFLAAAIGISLLTGASAVYAAPPQTEAAYEQEDLNEQLVMALAWTQNAAEYRELCYQGYNCVNYLPHLYGEHGYDPTERDMHVIFKACGPDFKKGYKQPDFYNVDIYPLLCNLLGIKPAKNDGDIKRVKGMLKN